MGAIAGPSPVEWEVQAQVCHQLPFSMVCHKVLSPASKSYIRRTLKKRGWTSAKHGAGRNRQSQPRREPQALSLQPPSSSFHLTKSSFPDPLSSASVTPPLFVSSPPTFSRVLLLASLSRLLCTPDPPIPNREPPWRSSTSS